MSNKILCLLLLGLFYTQSWAQDCNKVWHYQPKTNNIQIDEKVYQQTGFLCLRFGTSKKKLIADFMRDGIADGVYKEPLLVNGQPFYGEIEARDRNNKLLFQYLFRDGIRSGQAAHYDKKGQATSLQFDASSHPKYQAPLEPIEPEPYYPIQVEKPVIYLYPTAPNTAVSVKLNFDPKTLSHSYPKYEPQTGWQVIAQPNGDLQTSNGKSYYALFWEALHKQPFKMESGFVVKGEQTAEFLEEKLAFLGLNSRESNEFIMFWLPRLENNPYNLIHFATDDYTEQYPLDIQPQPEQLIRVFMVCQPLNAPIQIPTQTLQPAQRKGFTVVEWGGSIQPRPKS